VRSPQPRKGLSRLPGRDEQIDVGAAYRRPLQDHHRDAKDGEISHEG